MPDEAKDLKSTRKKRITIYIVLSLLIHAFYFFFISEYGFQKRTLSFIQELMKNITPEEKKVFEEKKQQREIKKIAAYRQQETKRQAQLRAGKSSFGWVYFQDAPVIKEQSVPTTIDKPLEVVTQALATEEQEIVQQPIKHKKTTKKTAEQKSKEIIKEAAHETKEINIIKDILESPIVEKPVLKAEAATEIKTSTSTIEPKSESKTIDVNQEHEDEELEDSTPDIAFENTEKTAQVTAPATTFARGSADHTTKKPKRNIIALTKGFIENIKDEGGTDLFNRDGDPNIKESIEEMAHTIYQSKIIWALQASWKQNFENTPHLNVREGIVHIKFTIDEHGKVVTSEILQSSGHQKTDDIILKTIAFATMPPIPKNFGMKTYTINGPLRVISHKIGF